MRASLRIGGYVLLAAGVVVLGSSLLGVGLLSVGKSRASASILAVQPPSQVVHVGDTVNVDLKVSDVTNLAAWQVRFKYDPAILQFAGYEKTDWLDSTGRSQQCLSAIVDGVHGTAQFGCNTFNPRPAGPDGDGVVAHVSFTALAAGTSDLALGMAGLADPLSQPGVFTSVTVNEGAAKVSDGSGDTALPPTPTPNPVTPTVIPGINDDLRLPAGAQAAATANAGAVASGAATPPSGVASAGSTGSAGPAGSDAAGDIFSGSTGSSPSGTGAPHAGTGTPARVPSGLARALAAALAVAGVACVLASRAGSVRRLLARPRR